MPKKKLKTFDAQAIKRRLLRQAKAIGKRKRITFVQFFDVMFGTH